MKNIISGQASTSASSRALPSDDPVASSTANNPAPANSMYFRWLPFIVLISICSSASAAGELVSDNAIGLWVDLPGGQPLIERPPGTAQRFVGREHPGECPDGQAEERRPESDHEHPATDTHAVAESGAEHSGHLR